MFYDIKYEGGGGLESQLSSSLGRGQKSTPPSSVVALPSRVAPTRRQLQQHLEKCGRATATTTANDTYSWGCVKKRGGFNHGEGTGHGKI
ncbi:hypothetical protein RIF29_15866 [Crotalaria pallida]|uniref:Uncharacterized protein n=1 Tax=Crotalaria pallida TaxID=3830 RepID=A0AAN9FLC9_CROPI